MIQATKKRKSALRKLQTKRRLDSMILVDAAERSAARWQVIKTIGAGLLFTPILFILIWATLAFAGGM